MSKNFPLFFRKR